MDRRFKTIICAVILMLVGATAGHLITPQPQMTVLFSPDGGIESEIVRQIETARKSIHVCAYYFTSTPIAEALIARRGEVDVRVVLDRSQEKSKWSAYTKLRRAGVDVRTCRAFPLMHNKFIIIDGELVQTGSFNYTARAERENAENVLFVHSPAVAAHYEREFERLWKMSRPVGAERTGEMERNGANEKLAIGSQSSHFYILNWPFYILH